MIGSRQYLLLMRMKDAGKPLAATEFDGMSPHPFSLHKTLVIMEKRGYAQSEMSAPRRKKGGKARRLFSITSEGRNALQTYEAELG